MALRPVDFSLYQSAVESDPCSVVSVARLLADSGSASAKRQSNENRKLAFTTVLYSEIAALQIASETRAPDDDS